jgi:hypothetical protein
MKRHVLTGLAIIAAIGLAACSQPTAPEMTVPLVISDGAGAQRGDPLSSTHLAGRHEVPPRDTQAQGQVLFRLDPSGTSISYKLIASNIENVFAAHIHLGSPAVNGPIVAFLFGPVAAGGGRRDGLLSKGTITAANLTGPLAGQSLSALLDAMADGNTYVNVHTDDGVAPTNTGPGDFPGGEIRGQLRAKND